LWPSSEIRSSSTNPQRGRSRVGLTTAELETAVRSEIGEDTAAKVSSAQVVAFLNQAQRKLCAVGQILLTEETASTVASQETYSVPSDYYKIDAVFLARGAGQTNIRLLPMMRNDRDPSASTGTPTRYYVSGRNVSGVNSFVIGLNPVPAASGTSDLTIHIRQMPLVMVSGGQAPEVPQPWQDALVSYAVWKALRRRGREWQSLAQEAAAEWADWLKKAERYVNPLMRDVPNQVYDNGGYLGWWD
jgi:hypothetical protein